MRIGLLSDTHGFLDEAIFTYFADCDEVWHAGDIGTLEILNRLKAFKPVRAVFGNVDGADLRAELPLNLSWSCEGVRVFMTHIGGHVGHYDARAQRELVTRKPSLFLCGHSHIARVERDLELGLIHMNPGACGHHGWHRMRTVLRMVLRAGKVKDVELIELGPRGNSPN